MRGNDGFESGHFLGRDRICRQHFELQWIDELAVLFHPEVQMRPCGVSGAAYISDDLALFDLGALPARLGVFAHVVVDGLVAVAVLDLDIFALRLVGADIGPPR